MPETADRDARSAAAQGLAPPTPVSALVRRGACRFGEKTCSHVDGSIVMARVVAADGAAGAVPTGEVDARRIRGPVTMRETRTGKVPRRTRRDLDGAPALRGVDPGERA